MSKCVIPSAVGRPAGGFELAVASAECVEVGLVLASPWVLRWVQPWVSPGVSPWVLPLVELMGQLLALMLPELLLWVLVLALPSKSVLALGWLLPWVLLLVPTPSQSRSCSCTHTPPET